MQSKEIENLKLQTKLLFKVVDKLEQRISTLEKVLEELCYQNLQASIQLMLFQSLYAEQASRFQSMDSATRNAGDLLEITQRQYNKLRQAKITKELSELSANFSK